MGCSLFKGPGRLPLNLPQTIITSLDFTPSLPVLDPIVRGGGPSWVQRSQPGSGRKGPDPWTLSVRHTPSPPRLSDLWPLVIPSFGHLPSPLCFCVYFCLSFCLKHTQLTLPPPPAGLHPLPLPGQLLSRWGSAGSGAVLSWSSGCRISGEGLWGARRGGGGDLQVEDPPGWWASPLL